MKYLAATELADVLRPLIGFSVRRTRVRAGSFLLIDLLPPAAIENTHENELSPMIWVYMGVWSLARNGLVIAASEDDRQCIADAADTLVGRRMSSIEIEHGSMDLSIDFETVRLITFSTHTLLSEEGGMDVEWAIWLPKATVTYATPRGGVMEKALQSDLTRQRRTIDD